MPFFVKTAIFSGFLRVCHKSVRYIEIQIEKRGENVNGKEQDTSGYSWQEHANEFFASERGSRDAEPHRGSKRLLPMVSG